MLLYLSPLLQTQHCCFYRNLCKIMIINLLLANFTILITIYKKMGCNFSIKIPTTIWMREELNIRSVIICLNSKSSVKCNRRCLSCSPVGDVTKIHCPSDPVHALLPFQYNKLMFMFALFANRKWRKLASPAEQIIMTPNRQRNSVRKHFEFNTIDKNKEKSVDKGKAVCRFWSETAFQPQLSMVRP